jgi:branched-chain amino acid transport system ATP-binding protein
LLAAAERAHWWSAVVDLVYPRPSRVAVGSVEETLELVGISGLADVTPSALSLGQRKLVALARALAARPSLVLLDEPAAGLDVDESRLFGDTLRRVVQSGTTVLLVDHDMGLVLGACDFVYTMEFGVMIASGTPKEIREDERVIQAYLGSPGSESVVVGGRGV